MTIVLYLLAAMSVVALAVFGALVLVVMYGKDDTAETGYGPRRTERLS
jgi:hypothetical protein